MPMYICIFKIESKSFIAYLSTAFSRSLDPSIIVDYYIKWVKTLGQTVYAYLRSKTILSFHIMV